MSEPIADWSDLAAELDAWADTGRCATLWWRDDDATHPGPALDRLIDVMADAGVPLSLAVIPDGMTADLAPRLDSAALVQVLVHGFAHRNHAPVDEKKQELGAHRAPDMIRNDLSEGLRRIQSFRRAIPVLVPPWNRIAESVVAMLAAIGFGGLSAYGPRTDATILNGPIRVVNTHVDVIDWKAGRAFVGEGRALGRLVGHLRARRTHAVDPDEATGILTHHAVHDAGTWQFCGAVVDSLTAHPAVAWRDARSLFTPDAEALPA